MPKLLTKYYEFCLPLDLHTGLSVDSAGILGVCVILTTKYRIINTLSFTTIYCIPLFTFSIHFRPRLSAHYLITIVNYSMSIISEVFTA